MMRETDCGHCHICHGLLTILKRIENCSLFVSERIEPATCWRHLSNDKTLLVFTEVVASITTYYLFLNTIYSIKTKMCWLLVCYALLGVFATSQTQTVGSSNLCELSEGICMNGGTCVQQGEEIGNMNIACYCVQGFTGIICQDLDAIEPLTCFTCGVDGTTCETGSFSNKTCLQDQICVILNFNISLADGGSLALILRDCENPENVPANSCLSAQEYFGPGNNFTVEGTACYCNTDLCLGPISNTEDSLTTSRIFTEIATKEILQSTSQVEELRTMISAVDNVDKSASNDSFPIFSTDPDILPATLLTTPSTNVDAISDLFTELTSVTDGIWISETPQKEETSTLSPPTTSEGSLQTTSNISAPNSIVTSEKDSGDVVRCLLCTQIDGNGDCSDSDGYQTCGSGGEVCIVVNVTMISSRLDFVVQQTSAGCVDQTILEFSTTNGCISISEYIDVFQLDFSTQNSTGIVCLCDPEDFCNNITTLLTSSGQTSISSSTAASGGTSTSSSTSEKAECYECNGELACTSPSVPVVTCSTGQICVAVNISIGNDPQMSINMIRRGCEDALAGNRACLTAEDFLVRPTIVPFDVSSTEVNGRACFCDGNRCNENINQNNIENLVFLVQSEGLSDKVSLTWNILPTDVEIDGFLVQVKLIGLNEWITVSSLLSPEEREFIIEGVISADVREIRVIAVDQSKIAVMTSLTVPVRKIASGMRSHRTLSRGMIGIIVVIIVIILILMVVLLVAWKIRRSSLARCKEAALPY